MPINDEIHNVALVSLYTIPDHLLLEKSFGTLLACGYAGDLDVVAIDIKVIVSVVAMVPFTQDDKDNLQDQYFVVEKPGLDFAEVLPEDNVGS
jgi:hypothetical protein